MGNALKSVEKQLSNIQPKQPSKTDLNRLFNSISTHFGARNGLEGLYSQDIRRAPWILFTHPEDTPGSLAKNKRFCKSFLKWLNIQLKPNCISTLLFVFLREYPSELGTFHLWRKGISSCLYQSQNPRLQLVRKRCDRFQLLAEDGPQRFSEIILDDKIAPNKLFLEAGLTGQLEAQGFSHAVYRDILKRVNLGLSSGLQQNDLLKRLFSFASVEDEKGMRLRFETGAKDLAEALLLPYADNKAHSGHHKELQSFLVDLMGDPRIVKSHWIGVNPRAKEVMFGWLVEATLDVFFRILDKSADKIWRYRKAFWSAYYKKGYIQHAWAVLGNDAVSIAKQIDDRKIRFGQLSGAYSKNQSVLLLRIGDLIIAEWSHNGKCRIWRDTEQNQSKIPKLYNALSDYNAFSLRKEADFEQVHHASEYGTWQYKVERFIRHQTNIKVFQVDYMP